MPWWVPTAPLWWVPTALPQARAARTDIVHLALVAAVGHHFFLRAVARGQLFQHGLVTAGQDQPGALGFHLFAVAIDRGLLLFDGTVQPVEEARRLSSCAGLVAAI
ncbi:hypothetical protein VM57_09780 [Stenotrophomonas maltophilia]|uniref:Uncharacterized protein n=1 Tax=Stenotrophomonas maltophilia TaxID=40324 RepID=A0A0F5ZQH7_STEMA|nr:hypothetical protein VM57_09780 [Stenotrophomonas maltophilia]